jgi:hypothetical protein
MLERFSPLLLFKKKNSDFLLLLQLIWENGIVPFIRVAQSLAAGVERAAYQKLIHGAELETRIIQIKP